MATRLSILIPTTYARSEIIQFLLENLNKQLTDEVEVLLNEHETDYVGKKRNDLLKQAQGDYVVFVDSDDNVSDNYVELILKAIETNPDCVGINGIMSTDRRIWNKWFISLDYTHWYEEDGVYYRTPNHISPIRREFALQAGFPEISNGEDAVYSERVKPLLKTEVKIEQPIYHYDFFSQK